MTDKTFTPYLDVLAKRFKKESIFLLKDCSLTVITKTEFVYNGKVKAIIIKGSLLILLLDGDYQLSISLPTSTVTRLSGEEIETLTDEGKVTNVILDGVSVDLFAVVNTKEIAKVLPPARVPLTLV